MMRSRSFIVALAVLVLAPVAASAQQGGMGRGGMGQGMGGLMAARNLVEQGSVEFLLSKGTELQLTAEQSAALKTIADKWTADTKAPREQLAPMLPAGGQAVAAMGAGGGDMQALRQRFEQMAPVMQKLVEDDQKAVADALKHLGETQQAAARRLLEERNQPRRPGTF
jgi:hypothetical protein